MAKPILIIGISDESYLLPLELAFAEKLYDVVEMEVISDSDYFKRYFMTPRTADILVIDEAFYSAELKRHNIGKIFLLTEEMSENVVEGVDVNREGQVIKIFKFLNISALVSSIIPSEWRGENKAKQGTQLITVVSAEGGSGCTTVAMGIASCFQQSLKRTLYVNVESFQNFHGRLNCKNELSMEGCTKMRNPSAALYMQMNSEIRKEQFNYFPPLPTLRHLVDISENAYIQLIKTAKASGDYDNIVVDMGDELSAGNLQLLDLSSKVIILSGQSSDSAFKLKAMLHNISCGDREKFHFICNKYASERENAFAGNEFAGMVKFEEYIPVLAEEKMAEVKKLVTVESLQKIAYELM